MLVVAHGHERQFVRRRKHDLQHVHLHCHSGVRHGVILQDIGHAHAPCAIEISSHVRKHKPVADHPLAPQMHVAAQHIDWRDFQLGEFCRTEFEKVLGFPQRLGAIRLGVSGHRRHAKPATHREPQPSAGSRLIHEMSGGSFGRTRRIRR